MKTLQDFFDLAYSFPIDQPDTVNDQTVSAPQQILKSLGIFVCGELEGTSKIIAFSVKYTKKVEIPDIGRMRVAHLIQWFGEEIETRVYSGSGDMPTSYDYSLNQVRNAIAAEAGKKTIRPGEGLGGGVWEINNRLILVGSHELAIYNGKFVKSSMPDVDDRLMDFGDTGQWYDFEKLSGYLDAAGDAAWRQGVLDELTALFSKWDNWKHDYDATLCSALTICTWLQSIWDWRPLVFVTGATNSGKSMLLQNTLVPLYGGQETGLVMFSQETSEAGLRQTIGQSSKVCILDEFESGKNRQLILRLARTSGRGGNVVRGTAAQRANNFGLKHILWCGAIETGLTDAADRNRFILLELQKVNKKPGEATLKLPSRDQLGELGMKALAVGMRLWRPVKARAKEIHDMGVSDVDHRLVESYSLPCAMLGVILGLDVAGTHGLMCNVLDGRELREQQVSDEEQVFNEIMGSVMHISKGVQYSISQVLFNAVASMDGGNTDALERHGIRWVTKKTDGHSGSTYLFFSHDIIRRQLLKGTRFENAKIDEVLCRMDGAERDRQRIAGARSWGVLIPEVTARKLSGNEDGEVAVSGEDAGAGTF